MGCSGHFNVDTLCGECSEDGDDVQAKPLFVTGSLLLGISPNISLELSKVLSPLDCKKLKGKKWNIEED